ncbi:MAG: hypothetical protein LBP60_09920 [Spirochaetaceae bacterium]|jgi:hypothetical protein|nr:hypothetical protein [Spirochaetaceae bacterium]
MNAHRYFLVVSLACSWAIRGFTLDVGGIAPELSGTAPGLPAAQADLDLKFSDILTDIGGEISNIDPKPWKVMRGFADASVFAGTGASQRAYEGYEYFAFTIGSLIGVRLSSSNLNFMDEFSGLNDTLQEKGDIDAGLNVQALTGQLGINTSAFLLKNLYLGLRFGYFDLNAIDNFTFRAFSAGVTGNYQLVQGADLVPDRVSWRGVGLGLGFIFQQTHIEYSYALNSYEKSFTGTGIGGTVRVSPELIFDMKINTLVIPLEINTALQVWFVNINFGLGTDLAFGRNSMNIEMEGAIDTGIWGNDFFVAAPGSLSLNAGGSSIPTTVNPKLTLGLGFKFGPVVLDIPFTYFFLTGYGIFLGVSLGVVL